VGYDVHITRAEDWIESESKPISLGEWQSYIQSDPELRPEPCDTATNPTTDQVITVPNKGFAVWTAHPEGDQVWFGYWRGCITAKNPDKAILEKMSQIAARLNARVIGDEGEEYPAAAGTSPFPAAKPWWKRLLGG
jgi:hypothetical protein